MKPTTFAAVLLSITFIICGTLAVILITISDPSTHPFRLLFGIIFLLSAAAIAARALTVLLTRKSGSLFFPSGGGNRPPPRYSIAQAQKIQGKYREAFDRYHAISQQYPQEITAWREMLEICLEHLDDRTRACEILKKGLATLTSQKGREVLQQTWDELV